MMKREVSERSEAPTGAFHRVAPVSRVPLGNSIGVTVEDQRFAVFHTPEGYFAITNRCPHQGAPLAGSALVGESKARCALHGWLFELNPAKLKGRGDELSRPPVRIVDGHIELFVEDEDEDY